MNEIFVKKPHLPEKEVSCVAVSCMFSDIITELKKAGVNTVIPVSACKDLQNAEQCHADMQILHLGDDRVLVLKNSISLADDLKQNGFTVTFTDLMASSEYPHNVLLNILQLNNHLFGKHDFADKKIPLFYKDYCKTEVNQGYTKCSAAVVADNAIITADSGIYKAAINSGTDVLLISSGYIELPGMNYGFIGGCCGKLSKDILAFAGDIRKHPDYLNIKSFAENYHVNLIGLSNKKLTDIGGILPLKEYCV